MATYTTEGIVLRRQNFGEADRLLTIFTRGTGKIKAKARSVRKSVSKLAGHLDLLSCATMQIATGKTDIELVTQSQTVQIFRRVREDFQRTAAGMYAAELTDKITEFGAPDSRIYELLKQYLTELDTIALDKIDQHLAYYTFHLLKLSGFAPELTRCNNCQKTLSETTTYFVPERGELLCQECSENFGRAGLIDAPIFKALRFLSRETLDTYLRLTLQPQQQQSLNKILEELAMHIIDRDLNSRHLLH